MLRQQAVGRATGGITEQAILYSISSGVQRSNNAWGQFLDYMPQKLKYKF